MASGLNVVAVHAWRRSVVVEALRGLFLSVVINVLNVEGMQMSGEYTQDGEADVDEEVCAAARDDVDADGRDYKRAGVSLGLEFGISTGKETYRRW